MIMTIYLSDELMAYTEKKQDEMNKAIEVSELRDSVDIDMANGLLRDIRHIQICGEILIRGSKFGFERGC